MFLKILKPLLGRRYKVKGLLILLVSFINFADDVPGSILGAENIRRARLHSSSKSLWFHEEVRCVNV